MTNRVGMAWAPVNIALVKHWGYGLEGGAEPARPSLSLTLEHGASTEVRFSPASRQDQIVLNDELLRRDDGEKAARAYDFLRRLREGTPTLRGMAGEVRSETAVPVSAGMASSAAGAAAMALAGLAAASSRGGEPELGELMSACSSLGSLSGLRSLAGGGVALLPGPEGLLLEDVEIALDLVVFSCEVGAGPKEVSSSEGHLRAPSSPFWTRFRDDGSLRVQALREALGAGDWSQAIPLIEADTLAMHGVMMTSAPPIFYGTDRTWRVWRQVATWRETFGLAVACTLDAGANPHLVVPADQADELQDRLRQNSDVHSLWRSAVSTRGASLVGSDERGSFFSVL